MMRSFSLRWFALFAVLVLLSAGCGETASDNPETSQAPSTTKVATTISPASTTTTDNVPTTSAPETTTTTFNSTTTTVDPALLPDPAAMELLVRDYCAAWPNVTQYLAEDVEFADVPADGWVPAGVPGIAGFVKEIDEAVARGPIDVAAALSATGFSTIDCGGPTVISADWIVFPVSASRPDGTGEEGLWLFRIVKDLIHWHLAFGTDVDEVAAASTELDPVIAGEARSLCALYEGTFSGKGYVRDGQAVVDAMSDDPAIHAIPHNVHWSGASGVKTNVWWFPPHEIMTCGDVTTNGRWSAIVSTVTNTPENIALIGITVQQHIDGKISRQYNNYTQTSGWGLWGLPLDE